MHLYPFQKETVKTLLSNNKNYLLADEQGLGKTVQIAAYFKLNKQALPAVIVCPSSLKLNWSREIEKWAGVKTFVIEGKKPQMFSDEFVKKYPVWIINYDILGSEDKEERKKENDRKEYCKNNNYIYKEKVLQIYGWVDEINNHNFKTIVADEIQYISEPKTLRSRGVQKICNNESRKIFLSGTPYETKTSQFFTCLNILNKSLFPNRWKFLMEFCNPILTRFGWQFNGLSNGDKLHKLISTLMIRRLKKDVLTELPSKQRIVVPMNISTINKRLYNEADDKLRNAILNKEKNALTRLTELKQAAVKCKIDACIQWIKEYLQINDKLVVFVYHTAIFDLLMEKFKGVAVGVNGATSSQDRQKNVDSFQKNEKIKLFIGNISACCTGITLTKSKATCFIEFGRSYSQMVQAEDRVHRIGQEADCVFAYYLIMENSIDEIVLETINERSSGINKVMDNSDEKMFDCGDISKDILNKYAKQITG